MSSALLRWAPPPTSFCPRHGLMLWLAGFQLTYPDKLLAWYFRGFIARPPLPQKTVFTAGLVAVKPNLGSWRRTKESKTISLPISDNGAARGHLGFSDRMWGGAPLDEVFESGPRRRNFSILHRCNKSWKPLHDPDEVFERDPRRCNL